MKAVIIAGGLGSRMGKISKVTPKALLEISGKPLLEYQLELLKKYGFKQVFVLTNYLSEKIEKFCADRSNLGLQISCLRESRAMGTAGGLNLWKKHFKEDFLVFYGDEMINMDLARMINFHNRQKQINSKLVGTVAVHPNDHPCDSDLVETEEDNFVKNFLIKPHKQGFWYKNLASTPVYVLTPKIFQYIPKTKPSYFGSEIFPKILKAKSVLAAYQTPEYIKDVGTPKRLKEVIFAVKSGKFNKGNLAVKRPAVMLDRDGVINREVGNLRRLEDFVLLPGAAKAIKKINQSGYYAVVASNQPVVAKGFCSLEYLLEIHKKMETLLGQKGAFLDAVYFCPHHPDKGFPGENRQYKIECECRKPKLGMFIQAVKDLNIDIKNSYMIGDRTPDAEFARRAGLKFVGVKTGDALKDGKYRLKKHTFVAKNLLEAVDKILK